METFIKKSEPKLINTKYLHEQIAFGTTPLSFTEKYEKLIEGLKFNHFAVIASAILIGSCLGSIAAMSLFYYHAPIWVFAIGLFATMANLIVCIAQAPTKWVVNLFAFSALVNTVLIIIAPFI